MSVPVDAILSSRSDSVATSVLSGMMAPSAVEAAASVASPPASVGVTSDTTAAVASGLPPLPLLLDEPPQAEHPHVVRAVEEELVNDVRRLLRQRAQDRQSFESEMSTAVADILGRTVLSSAVPVDEQGASLVGNTSSSSVTAFVTKVGFIPLSRTVVVTPPVAATSAGKERGGGRDEQQGGQLFRASASSASYQHNMNLAGTASGDFGVPRGPSSVFPPTLGKSSSATIAPLMIAADPPSRPTTTLGGMLAAYDQHVQLFSATVHRIRHDVEECRRRFDKQAKQQQALRRQGAGGGAGGAGAPSLSRSTLALIANVAAPDHSLGDESDLRVALASLPVPYDPSQQRYLPCPLFDAAVANAPRAASTGAQSRTTLTDISTTHGDTGRKFLGPNFKFSEPVMFALCSRYPGGLFFGAQRVFLTIAMDAATSADVAFVITEAQLRANLASASSASPSSSSASSSSFSDGDSAGGPLTDLDISFLIREVFCRPEHQVLVSGCISALRTVAMAPADAAFKHSILLRRLPPRSGDVPSSSSLSPSPSQDIVAFRCVDVEIAFRRFLASRAGAIPEQFLDIFHVDPVMSHVSPTAEALAAHAVKLAKEGEQSSSLAVARFASVYAPALCSIVRDLQDRSATRGRISEGEAATTSSAGTPSGSTDAETQVASFRSLLGCLPSAWDAVASVPPPAALRTASEKKVVPSSRPVSGTWPCRVVERVAARRRLFSHPPVRSPNVDGQSAVTGGATSTSSSAALSVSGDRGVEAVPMSSSSSRRSSAIANREPIGVATADDADASATHIASVDETDGEEGSGGSAPTVVIRLPPRVVPDCQEERIVGWSNEPRTASLAGIECGHDEFDDCCENEAFPSDHHDDDAASSLLGARQPPRTFFGCLCCGPEAASASGFNAFASQPQPSAAAGSAGANKSAAKRSSSSSSSTSSSSLIGPVSLARLQSARGGVEAPDDAVLLAVEVSFSRCIVKVAAGGQGGRSGTSPAASRPPSAAAAAASGPTMRSKKGVVARAPPAPAPPFATFWEVVLRLLAQSPTFAVDLMGVWLKAMVGASSGQ